LKRNIDSPPQYFQQSLCTFHASNNWYQIKDLGCSLIDGEWIRIVFGKFIYFFKINRPNFIVLTAAKYWVSAQNVKYELLALDYDIWSLVCGGCIKDTILAKMMHKNA